jgi:hypothetical protein
LVADFTALDQIRPGRSVAAALVALDPDLARFRWQQYGWSEPTSPTANAPPER